MEHRKKGRKLSRTASHRKAMLSNLSIGLIKAKRIKTTEAKAKELRTVIEPLVTKAKNAKLYPEKSIHLRRVAASFIKDKEAVKILFDEIGEAAKDRQGGYTRILKTGFRKGDGASEAIIEFVDFDIVKTKESKADAKESRKKAGAKIAKETGKESEVKEKKSKTVKEKDSELKKTVKSKDKSESKTKGSKSKTESGEKSKGTPKHKGKKKD